MTTHPPHTHPRSRPIPAGRAERMAHISRDCLADCHYCAHEKMQERFEKDYRYKTAEKEPALNPRRDILNNYDDEECYE